MLRAARIVLRSITPRLYHSVGDGNRSGHDEQGTDSVRDRLFGLITTEDPDDRRCEAGGEDDHRDVEGDAAAPRGEQAREERGPHERQSQERYPPPGRRGGRQVHVGQQQQDEDPTEPVPRYSTLDTAVNGLQRDGHGPRPSSRVARPLRFEDVGSGIRRVVSTGSIVGHNRVWARQERRRRAAGRAGRPPLRSARGGPTT